MKPKRKLINDSGVQELIKRAAERVARDLGISPRNTPIPQNMCAAATAKYNKIRATTQARHPTGGCSENEFMELLDARLAMDRVCDH
jgi:hypothetical protein